METARGRAQRRHVREKATIDHLVRDVYEPKTPDEKHTERSLTTSNGLPPDSATSDWLTSMALLVWIRRWPRRSRHDIRSTGQSQHLRQTAECEDAPARRGTYECSKSEKIRMRP